MTNQKAEEITAYVCDNLCRHSHNSDLTQDDLDRICSQCKLAQMVSITSGQKVVYQKPEVLTRKNLANMTCRNFLMGRFMGIR